MILLLEVIFGSGLSVFDSRCVDLVEKGKR
jgi:hypothetical protein